MSTKLTKVITLFVFFFSFVTFSAKAIDLEFYFPVAVGGAAATTVEELTNRYMELNPDVNIKPIYAGSYTDATTKAITAAKGGNPPPMAVLIAIDIFKFYDEDLILGSDGTFNASLQIDNNLDIRIKAYKNNTQVGKTLSFKIKVGN